MGYAAYRLASRSKAFLYLTTARSIDLAEVLEVTSVFFAPSRVMVQASRPDTLPMRTFATSTFRPRTSDPFLDIDLPKYDLSLSASNMAAQHSDSKLQPAT